MILLKKTIIWPWGQSPTKVITVCDTPPYGHAYTNYLSMNSFVGFIWPWGQGSRSHKGHYSTRHTALWSCTHIPIIIDLPRKTKMLWPRQENTIQKTIIWPWGQRSRSQEGQYGTRHTTLWSCTHIRNIIYLSRKTKKLWSRQALLRSGRKNQTKTICQASTLTFVRYQWRLTSDK